VARVHAPLPTATTAAARITTTRRIRSAAYAPPIVTRVAAQPAAPSMSPTRKLEPCGSCRTYASNAIASEPRIVVSPASRMPNGTLRCGHGAMPSTAFSRFVEV
jgi:hypothetical protein